MRGFLDVCLENSFDPLVQDESTWRWGCERCGRADVDPSEAPDAVRRLARSCDGVTSNLAFEWAPGLRRCPWSVLADEDEVWMLIDLWQDVELLGDTALPYPGGLMEQPAFVYEALRKCAQTKAEIMSEPIRRLRKEREK